jgi:potassium voltage-gated channel Shaw-related subfamily C protein
LATLPSLREEHVNATTLAWYAYMYDIKLWINFNNPKEVMFVTTDNPLWIFYLNLVVIVFFSLETISRFLACPCRCKFFREWLNILDIILLLGMWINHGLAKTPPLVFLENEKLAYLVCAFDALSVLRLLRLFRLAKQYNSLKILYFALKASCKELLLLLITFLVLGWVFANLVYYVEIRESETFPDMLVAMWWAVVTMTTVGYGDMYPRSRLGHIVGSMCAMTGLLVLAMPIAVIAGKFNDMYMKNKEREFYNTLHNETVHTRVTVKEENKVEPYPVKCEVIKRKKVFLQQVKEENKVEPYIPC